MNRDLKELLNTIAKNPTLPVFPVVYNSFVDWFDDNPFVDYTVGKIHNVKVDKYCIYTIDGNKQFATIDDKEFLEHEYPKLKFEWKDAIFFCVGYNENLLK